MKKHLSLALWFLSLLWLTLLLWLSSQDGSATARTSGWLTALIIRLLGLQAGRFSQMDRPLRTLAHFGGFLLLGALSYMAAHLTWAHARRIALPVFLVCAALGVLDEVKKVLIPGRHLSWPEAGLNALGALCGVLAALGISRLARRRRPS